MSRLSDLRVPIRRRLGDPGSVRWTDDTIPDFWINRASTHVACVTRCLAKEVEVSTVANTQEYGAGGDESVLYTVRSIKLRLTSTYERDLVYLPFYRAGLETWTTGEPRYWSARRLDGVLRVQFYPIPAAIYVTIWNGYHTPTALGSASSYTQLPQHIENVPGHLVQSMMEAGNQDYENATLSYQKYRAELLKSQMAMARS